ncbi:MAG: hypothetical protein FJY86_01580 [Candidatus Diapherotrites archaeon]|uniref:Uncharacterized protein n=1 Tax=Candidatus Iainarchaeum sp. TaxID=3101447 RepID=A0A8T4CA60_9ARCH|nr:hypothetical protein [Candidatus Diapherotrites archaeon]
MKATSNTILLGIALLCLSTLVWGDAYLVDPVVQKAKPRETVDAGRIMPGESVEIIFNKNSGYGKNVDWTQARIQNTHNEEGFITQDSGVGTDSLITKIQTNLLTPEGVYDFPLEMIGNNDELLNETYILRVTVQKNLVNASLIANQLSGGVNEPSTFTVLLVNDSSASTKIEVIPALPQIWAKSQIVNMTPHSFKEVSLNVTPRFAGPKTFDIRITKENSETISNLKGTIVANPTLKDRYGAGLYGFPFFTISLVANYLANAFVSFLL